VLTAGTTLLTLTPLRVPLEAEVWVLASDIGFSRVGDRCVLKIDAFDYTQHGTAEGTVRWISEGSYTTDQNNQPTAPYFKIHCSVEKYNFRGVPQNFRLVPGMTLTGDLMAGTRSVIGYLFSGVLHAYYQAMREPN
jgi:hemolysin D